MHKKLLKFSKLCNSVELIKERNKHTYFSPKSIFVLIDSTVKTSKKAVFDIILKSSKYDSLIFFNFSKLFLLYWSVILFSNIFSSPPFSGHS